MKKFNKSDIFHNIIRTYPKVEFFYNNGTLFLDRQNYPDASSDIPFGNIGLYELVNRIYSNIPGDLAILTESTDFLASENNFNLIQE